MLPPAGGYGWLAQIDGRSRRSLMEEFVNPTSCLGADTIDLQQIGYGGALNRLERAEMVKQSALARGADARNLLQAGLTQLPPAPGSMRTDGKTVRFVTKPLDEVKHRIPGRQLE